jgi:hypothetical protein
MGPNEVKLLRSGDRGPFWAWDQCGTALHWDRASEVFHSGGITIPGAWSPSSSWASTRDRRPAPVQWAVPQAATCRSTRLPPALRHGHAESHAPSRCVCQAPGRSAAPNPSPLTNIGSASRPKNNPTPSSAASRNSAKMLRESSSFMTVPLDGPSQGLRRHGQQSRMRR